MLRSLKVLASLAAGAPLAVFLACSTGSGGNATAPCDVGGADGGACTAGATPAYTSCLTSADLTTPTVSFSQTIQPLFNQSCAFSGGECHGSPDSVPSMTGQVYLGSSDGGVDAAQVLAAIVGQASPEVPSMQVVKAGDPDNSYMMHKLDDDQCQFESACNATKVAVFLNCGQSMPYASALLDQDTRDNIRRWIAQGAKNN